MNTAREKGQGKEREKAILQGSVNDAASIIDMFRLAKRLATTASANAWGLLGAIGGDFLRALLKSLKLLDLGRLEPMLVGYVLVVAIYTLVVRSHSEVSKCLCFAELMLADNQVSLAEYREIRKNCLRRGGLIGSQ